MIPQADHESESVTRLMPAEKVPYICGALTNLPIEMRDPVKVFYSAIGDLFGEICGRRAFVPHEHYDPIKFAHYTPKEVDQAERNQVCHKTSLLVVCADFDSWGGGIEVEMARANNVPVIILGLEGKKISRLLLENEAVKEVIYYKDLNHALVLLREWIRAHLILTI